MGGCLRPVLLAALVATALPLLSCQSNGAKELRQCCPPPEWWSTVSGERRVGSHAEISAYWLDRQRSDRQFFKAAYQAILDYPADPGVVVIAVYLMSSADRSYPQKRALQQYALDRWFSYRTPGARDGASEIAGIVLDAAEEDNDAHRFAAAQALVERILQSRQKEINPHQLQLLHIEWARALDGQGQTARAIDVLTRALDYAGSWKERLQADIDAYRTKMKRPAAPHAADKVSCEAQGGTWGRFGLYIPDDCNLPTGDAGRACSGSSDCQSACIADDKVPKGSATQGKCFGHTILRGTCLNHVKAGRADGVLCID